MQFKIREVFLKVVPVCKDTFKTESKKEKQRVGSGGWSRAGNRRGQNKKHRNHREILPRRGR